MHVLPVQVASAAPKARIKILADSGVASPLARYNSSGPQWARNDLPHMSDIELGPGDGITNTMPTPTMASARLHACMRAGPPLQPASTNA